MKKHFTLPLAAMFFLLGTSAVQAQDQVQNQSSFQDPAYVSQKEKGWYGGFELLFLTSIVDC